MCYSQCCAQHAGWDGWHAKLKLLQPPAGGEPAEQKNLAGLLSHLWDEQTNRPDRNRRAPPCAQLAHPARPAWGEPKRARRSVPTQPPTWASPGHLHACSACLLLVVPAFLRPSKTGRQGGVTPGSAGTVLYLLWYYHLLLQAVGSKCCTIGNAKGHHVLSSMLSYRPQRGDVLSHTSFDLPCSQDTLPVV